MAEYEKKVRQVLHENGCYLRLFQNSSFRKATLDLSEETAFRTFLRKPFPKLARVLEMAHLIRRGKGDHDIWFSPITNMPITVDGEIKSRYTANAIWKFRR